MKKSTWTCLFLVASIFFAFSGSAARLDLRAEVDAARARKQGVDSVIVVYQTPPTAGIGLAKGTATQPSSPASSWIETPQRIGPPPTPAKAAATTGGGLVNRSAPPAIYRAALKPGADLVEVLRELNNAPNVAYAEPNWRVQALGVPNDSFLSELFTLNNTNQETYVLQSDGLGRTNALFDADMDWIEAWTNSVSGKMFPTNEIVVAVIDTGVDYTHADLTNQMWRNSLELNGTPGFDDDGNGYVDDVYGYDFFYDDADPMDIEDEGGSHGTHVAGTIAAEADNGYGICGVNPHARIMALKFLGPEGGYTSDAIEAIFYAVDNGADVINNSWGGGAWQRALQVTIDYAVSNGVVFLAASGNNNSGSPAYPAAYRGSIAVNSFNWNDEKAYYSNYGEHTDVSAHGSDILSLKAFSFTEYPQYVVSNDFVVFHGTSMACPNAAGAMSLLVARHPGLHPYLYERVMEASCDTAMLANSVNKKYKNELGAGRINVSRMLNDTPDTGFIRVLWADDTSLAVPGQSFAIHLIAGLWTNAHADVKIVATNVTSGISLNQWTLDLGAMDGLAVTNMPTNTFVATIDIESTNQYERLYFNLVADGETLDTKRLQISFVNSNAKRILVEDFDADGTNEIAAIYFDYTLLYNHQTQLLWIAESTLGDNNWTYNLCAGDLTGDGRKEIVSTEHRWILSAGPPAMFTFDFEGDLLDGFPIVMTNTSIRSSKHGFGEPALVDVDEDGILEIVCNMLSSTNETSFVRVYEGDGSILWERNLPYSECGPPSAADLDGDGWEEIVVWNNNNFINDKPDSSLFILDGDGTVLREIALDEGFISEAGDFHFPDEALTALGDIDGDDDLEIICHASKGRSNYRLGERVYAFHHDGIAVEGFPVDLPISYGSFYTHVRLADADNDGDNELFFQRRVYDTKQSHVVLYCLNDNGTALPGFPSDPQTLWNAEPPEMDDLDGDGSLDLLIEAYHENPAFYGLDISLNTIGGLDPFIHDEAGWPVVDDMVLCGFAGSTNRHIAAAMGYDLVLIDTGFPRNDLPLAWPMRHQNVRRTSAVVPPVPGGVYRASFSATPRMAISNLTASFTATVEGFDPSTTWFHWDFDGDGSADQSCYGVSTAAWPYSIIGIYDVSLSVSNAAGKTFTRTKPDYINILPPVQAAFHAVITNAQTPIMIRFIDDSINQPQSWAWDFNGDGITDSTEQSPEFYYVTPNLYPVTLTVSNDFGDNGSSSDTLTKTAYLNLTDIGDTSVKYVSPTGLGLYPYKTWQEAATNIQDAIDAAGNDDTVLLDDGTYVCGDGNALEWIIDDTSHSRDRLTIASRNGSRHTVIRGWEIEPLHRGFHVVSAEDPVFSGIAFSNIYSSGGGGIRLGEGAGHAAVSNCIFRNCDEQLQMAGGSAVLAEDEGVHLADCLVEQCDSRKGSVLVRTKPGFDALIENCIFRANGAGGLYDYIGALYIDSRCAQHFHPGGTGDVTVRNSAFTANNGSIAIVYGQSDAAFENCTFNQNTLISTEGAVLRTKHFSGIELEGTNQGPWSVVNSILHDNTAPVEFSDQPASPIGFSHCALATSVSGTGNIITNDAGVSALPGDFHLAFGSPCIDAASALGWMSGASDLDGDARTVHGSPDIGADEVVVGCRVAASSTAGTSTLHVAFSAEAFSFAGALTNWHWNFGDDSSVEFGATLSNTVHDYTSEGNYVAVLTVFDDAGNAASNGAIIRVDDTGPAATDADAIASTNVIVRFSEPVDESSSETVGNYSLDTVSILGAEKTDDHEILLTVMEMTDKAKNTLTVSGVQDIYGNVMIGTNTLSFTYRDPEADSRLFFDFGGTALVGTPTTNVNWNNIASKLKDYGGAVTNAVNASGVATEIDLQLLKDFDSYLNSESLATNILYPATAQKDALVHTKTPRTIHLSDLDPSLRYDLIFFAASDYDYTTRYWVGDRFSDSLNVLNNLSNTVEITEVEPDGSNSITFEVQKVDGAGCIGVLEIHPRRAGLELSIDGLSAIDGTPDIPVNEGGQSLFYLRLTEEPTTVKTVTVSRIAGDESITLLSGETVVLDENNWDHWQFVQIDAAEDPDAESDEAIFEMETPFLIRRTLTAVEVDDELGVSVSTSTLFVAEGGTADFGVKLTMEPTGTYTVTVSQVSGDHDLSVESDAEIEFTTANWHSLHPVTLAAALDNDRNPGIATFQVALDGLHTQTVQAIEVEAHFNALAYEGFNYPDGEIDGQVGGIGWTNAWSGLSCFTVVQPPSEMTFSSGDVVISGGANALRIDGQNTLFSLSRGLTNQTQDIWFSFLIAKTNGNHYSNNHVLVGDLNGSRESGATFGRFASGTADNLAAAVADNVVTEVPSATAEIGTTCFVVCKLTWDEADERFEQSDVWVNPASLTSELAEYHVTAIDSDGFLAGGLKTLFIAQEDVDFDHQFLLDEIRVGTSWSDVVPAPVEDVDSDGLPDVWETSHFEDLSANPGDTAANGINTVIECYIAGISPVDANARFALETPAANILQWQGVSGRVYNVYWSSNLIDGFQTLETNLPWTIPPYTDTVHGADQKGFYKLETEME